MNSRLFALVLLLIVGAASAVLYFRPREAGTIDTRPAKLTPAAPALMTVDPVAPYGDDPHDRE